FQVILFVRRIEKDNVPRHVSRLPQKLGHFRTVNLTLLFRNPAQLQIRYNQLATPSRTIDKRHITRPARKRLNPNRARPRTEIEKPRLLNTRRDHVEKRLPQ